MTANKTLSKTFLLPQPGFSLNIFEQAVQDSTHLQPEAAKRNKQNNILLLSKSLSRVSVQSYALESREIHPNCLVDFRQCPSVNQMAACSRLSRCNH